MNDFLYKIYKWYKKNQRQLPWRETTDPYKIWCSEIILQQTRVDQGISFYLRFIERFPTISDLAHASEDEVLKLWQGLGYYSRARNLHTTAQTIEKKYQGVFPRNHNEIRNLKGIGPYTAAAVASIAFGLPYPAVDGNIYRVLARYFGISNPIDTTKGKKVFEEIARELIQKNNPGLHNQALMEFGALQCVPKSPDCNNCPVRTTCFAATRQKVAELPVKIKRAKQRNRFFYYFFLQSGENTWLEKRKANDIWKNLYQFPLIETDEELSDEELAKIKPDFLDGQKFNLKTVSSSKKHILSHQIIFARLIHLELDKTVRLNGNYNQVSIKDVSTFAVPRLIEILMKQTSYF
jgi:A/G-specific adenine glycosylase